MSDWPEAVRLYAALSAEWDSTGDVDSAEVLDRADDAIAALKEMVEAPDMDRRLWQARAEKAEAEVERLKWMLNYLLERSFPLSKDEWLADLAARYEKEEK